MPDAQIIPFPVPPPVARPILQPSIYARGVRNFTFSGKIDEWHAPGVQTNKAETETRAAIDAAWLVEKVLGAPRRRPEIWPGVPGVRERAIAFGQQVGLVPFQQEGAAFLAERDYGLLIDEMGIGKSCQAIVAAEARLSMGVIPDARAPAVLVICPALAKKHWQREIKRWSGCDSVILDTRTPDPEQLCERYVICNYDILFGGRERDAAGVMHALSTQPGWGMTLAGRFLIAICDEAHILRGRGALRTKATKTTLLKVPVVWGLTGTPMPNYVRDLFALVDTLSNGLWGYSYWDWARAYCNAFQGQYGWDDTGASRVDELQGRLAFFTLGRTAKGVHLELPEKRRETYRVDVQISAPSVAEGNKALSKNNAVAHALRYTARAKRSAVVGAAVEALQARQKVVVFLYMREQADAVAKDIRKHVDCNVMCVHGDLPPAGRDAQAQTFRESSAPAAFVATIDSMGVALSLVGAHLVIFGDLVPEPWKLLQAEKRCHRFDSVERVLVRYMIATGTIDEGIAESVIDKIPVIEQALGQQEDAGELTKMLGGKSTEEIVDSLFAKLKAWGEASGG
jgi:SWI/SNF-related matrix-associated actin-dependent regulator of chromatin subfamily A-like protein 1